MYQTKLYTIFDYLASSLFFVRYSKVCTRVVINCGGRVNSDYSMLKLQIIFPGSDSGVFSPITALASLQCFPLQSSTRNSHIIFHYIQKVLTRRTASSTGALGITQVKSFLTCYLQGQHLEVGGHCTMVLAKYLVLHIGLSIRPHPAGRPRHMWLFRALKGSGQAQGNVSGQRHTR